jgi:hypothetical protein
MTVTRRLNTTFTDQAVNPLPLAMPFPGVPGSTHAWLASKQAGVSGDVLTTMVATLGGVDLTQATAAKRPTLQIGSAGAETGVRSVRFDGVDDELVPASALVAGNIRTVMLLARVRADPGSQHGIFYTGTGYVIRTSGGLTQGNGGGTGASAANIAIAPDKPLYHCITMALGNDQAGNAIRSFTIDGTDVALNGDAQPTTVRIGQGFPGSPGNIDVLESRGWPFALTSAQRQALRAAAQANYPGLVA